MTTKKPNAKGKAKLAKKAKANGNVKVTTAKKRKVGYKKS